MSARHVVEHAGAKLSYSTAGRGDPVLFIQGVGVHGDGWRPQIDVLAERRRCIAFDHRCIGASTGDGASITVQRLADDARAILDAQGIGVAHVVGHSLGGMIAAELAITHPTRVRSLSLLCTFAVGRHVAPLTPTMAWLGLRTKIGTRAQRRRAFLRLVLPPSPRSHAELDVLATDLAPVFGHDLADQPAVVFHQLRALREGDVSRRLHELAAIPTLVVSARHDLLAPPKLGEALAQGIPGAQFEEVADAAHGLPITHPAWTNARLAAHFEHGDEFHTGSAS
ncbi:MAG: alpha/beta fold hydrolase [Planctomycetes bacterium]|nr:alpha/beta fold hydrolase [Planctomycetota bacterium]MCC7170021.1 alpha/beta fold hydrolase [Planctomycetota bacterium]